MLIRFRVLYNICKCTATLHAKNEVQRTDLLLLQPHPWMEISFVIRCSKWAKIIIIYSFEFERIFFYIVYEICGMFHTKCSTKMCVYTLDRPKCHLIDSEYKSSNPSKQTRTPGNLNTRNLYLYSFCSERCAEKVARLWFQMGMNVIQLIPLKVVLHIPPQSPPAVAPDPRATSKFTQEIKFAKRKTLLKSVHCSNPNKQRKKSRANANIWITRICWIGLVVMLFSWTVYPAMNVRGATFVCESVWLASSSTSGAGDKNRDNRQPMATTCLHDDSENKNIEMSRIVCILPMGKTFGC